MGPFLQGSLVRARRVGDDNDEEVDQRDNCNCTEFERMKCEMREGGREL